MNYYHVSPHTNQDSIRRQGLLPEYGRGYGVWMSGDPDDVDACQHINYEPTELDIWEIDATKLPHAIHTIVIRDKTYYRYDHLIPPDAMEILDTIEAQRINPT